MVSFPWLFVAAAFLLIAPATIVTGAQSKAPPKPVPEPLGESLCPPAISVEQRVTAAPEGWEAALSAAKPQLAMVTFFDGPPAERALLKYDREEKEKRDWVGIWTLAPNSRGYWIQCGYDNTTAVLSRRLPENIRTCKVTYERKAQTVSGLPVVKHVGCSDAVMKKEDEKKDSKAPPAAGK